MAKSDATEFKPPVWHDPKGEPVSCVEKIKVLNENLHEIREMCQEALEDAVLMGCDEDQFRAVIDQMTKSLINPYKK
jgi:C-terminal processing protease CtpA/Prc